MRPEVSVIICTKNPRKSYLRRVLVALSQQTLPSDCWELLLVDNSSAERLSEHWDLGWHRSAWHLREETTGLTHARLCGIKNSKGRILIFVDDDNLLSPTYLSQAIEIADEHPSIGAYGGSIAGEFEVQPQDWIEPYLPSLAVLEIDRDYWANLAQQSLAVPVGAGMCVRRNVAAEYLSKVKNNGERLSLDRAGTSLSSCGDTDLAWCAVDLGMGTGRFCKLKMTHLIPKERLSRNYTVKLQAGLAVSAKKLEALRSDLSSFERSLPSWPRVFRYLIWGPRLQRAIFLESWKEQKAAIKAMKKRAEEQPTKFSQTTQAQCPPGATPTDKVQRAL